ncbi:hypothetical protein L218DRAFT_131625 [Marasmius fiardii PR-910]|nr:hypothetical protein L218DRAFT_131625 [Marasmius fiardii PR-910]
MSTSQPRNPQVEDSEKSDANLMSHATSVGSQVQLLVTMPTPGAVNAPHFSGTRAMVFLETLKHMCDGTGLKDNEAVDQIYFYSSYQVQDTIQYNPAFNLDKTNKTWEAAKKALLRIYSSSDLAPAVTITDLQNFCKKQNQKPPFTTRSATEHYYQCFERLSSVLVCNSTITKAEAHYYFISGLPQEQRRWLESQLGDDQKTRENAPTIDAVLDLLYMCFDRKSLFYDPWKANLDPDLDRVRFDDEGERKNKHTEPSPPIVNRPLGQGVPSASIDDLAAQMEALKLSQAQVLSFFNQNLSNNPLPQNTPTDSNRWPQTTNNIYDNKRCFICGKEGNQLTHKLHPSHCPKTKALVAEGLVRWDEERVRYVLINGKDLPKVARSQQGGVAAFLREFLSVASSN